MPRGRSKGSWTPLWVWNGPNAPEGNRKLLAQGGLPLDEPRASTVLGVGGEPTPVPGEHVDEFEALKRYLAVPRTETEVCEELAIGRADARRLLKSGIDTGRFARAGKPFRYVVASAGQATLFDAA